MSALLSACDQASIDLIAQRMHDDEDGALALIEQSMAAWPLDARLYLLRGAIHAQRNASAAARADFSHAIVLDPGQHTARYMLGQLELVDGQAERAVAIWAPLLPLREQAIGRFAGGMTALIAGRTQEALAELRYGLELSAPEDALAAFFRTTVTTLERSIAEPAASSAAATDEDTGSHYLLAEYLSSRTQH